MTIHYIKKITNNDEGSIVVLAWCGYEATVIKYKAKHIFTYSPGEMNCPDCEEDAGLYLLDKVL